MDTQDQYISDIEQATGLKLGQFGFIDGTIAPFIKKNGIHSPSAGEGYLVWKKIDEGNYGQLRIYPPDKNQKQMVIDFLKS